MVDYMFWQLIASRIIRQLEREDQIDVVHHVTWASDSLPSAFLASRAPVRIWGPIGGTTRTARGLYRYLSAKGKMDEVIRNVMNGFCRRLFGTRAATHATLIVALNRDVEVRWGQGRRPVVVESNTALETAELTAGDDIGESEFAHERTALFVGRLIPWKGLLLAVESLRHAPNWRLVVFGEGPDQFRAAKLAQQIGVEDRLVFRGQVPRSEVLAAFRNADALLFTSFHDSAPWAVGEASALGCPVLCLDAGGPALQGGRNAHVVSIEPAFTLPQRIGEQLQELCSRGTPDDSLRADRLPGLLREWYLGYDAETASSRSPTHSL
jgi:glycosyltransferase involved in cell wall biosynthesis